MKKHSFVFKSIKMLTLAAMLTSMSVVIGIFCKSYLNFGAGLFRVTFEHLPIIISGMILGPVGGAMIGAASDLISYLLSPQVYPPNLIVTFGAAIVGVIPGVVSKFIIKENGYKQIIVSGIFAHLFGSVIIKSVGLFTFYHWSILWRIPLYLFAVAPIEIVLICLLYKNRSCRKILGWNSKRMNYKETLSYIHKVSWTGSRPGLERITELLHLLGDPQDRLRFIHVAGTNGKGSFCSMCDSVLREAGYKTGLYTSPYIERFNERITINGTPISDTELSEITSYVREFADKMEDAPTEFELITAVAMVAFERNSCDPVVLEVGMGGRLDATNIIKEPIMSVITGISLDHTAFLGNTVAEIAAEKAGIIKNGAPVLYGGTDDTAAEVIKTVALEKGSEFFVTPQSELEIIKTDLCGTVFKLCGKEYSIKLLGTYQPHNAANVICAVDILRKRGLDIDENALVTGLRNAEWKGRFEKLSDSPLVIIDGSHNPEGIAAAVDCVKKLFGDQNVILLSGVMKDKDYADMARELSVIAESAFTLKPDNPRSLDAVSYAEEFKKCGIYAEGNDDIKKSVEAALKRANKTGRPIIALGSLYMYGDVKKAILSMI